MDYEGAGGRAKQNRPTAPRVAPAASSAAARRPRAYGGEEAILLAQQVRPDVALIDLGMPDVDGLELCRRLRAQPWAAGMLLIAQTGWGQEFDRRRTQAAGFDHHLVKPLDLKLLDAQLQKFVNRPPV